MKTTYKPLLVLLALLFTAGSALAGDVAVSDASGELGVGTPPAPSPTFQPQVTEVAGVPGVVFDALLWFLISIGVAIAWGWTLAVYIRMWTDIKYPPDVTHVKFRAKDIRAIQHSVADMFRANAAHMGIHVVDQDDNHDDDWNEGFKR
jgi:hypothetical protein